MGRKTKEITVHCPHCDCTEVYAIPMDHHTNDPIQRLVRCARCGAIITVFDKDRRVEGRFMGESGEEVSKVIGQMLKGSKKSGVRVQISKSTIGLLNTGEIEDVKSISVNLSGLHASGHAKVAEALKHVAEAVASTNDLLPEERSEVLDQLAELSRQATLNPKERVKPGVLRALIVGLATTLGAAGGLAEVWSTWGPAIKAFFGF